MEIQGKMVLEYLAKEYAQLYLLAAEEEDRTELYHSVVRQGKLPQKLKELMRDGLKGFKRSDKDRLFMQDTPAGQVQVIYLYEREDFIHFLQIMLYRCEETKIPQTMGAAAIRGVINWNKIWEHRKEFLEQGGSILFWDREFKNFTKNKENYTENMIVLSRGGYSGLSFEQAGFAEEEWEEVSYKIRLYHECTHFICKTLFPHKKDPVRDEVIADCMGLLFATGEYDIALAGKFLGISKEGTYTGGRLENYVQDKAALSQTVSEIFYLIKDIAGYLQEYTGDNKDFYKILSGLEEKFIAS